jgi:mannosyltransferase OCH1-like enzyme
MQLIPRNLHYCWFGPNPQPDLVKSCIESWDKFLPDYNKVLWNEDTFDIDSNKFVKEAYEAKKYAFVSDYVRLYALLKYGGLYLDSDVEVIKNLDKFLIHPAFSGFEKGKTIPTGTMGSVQNHPWISRLLDYYTDRSFFDENGNMDLTTNVSIITSISRKEFGLRGKNQFIILKDNVYIYPSDYFCPINSKTKKILMTENTHTIHHFNGSWLDRK